MDKGEKEDFRSHMTHHHPSRLLYLENNLRNLSVPPTRMRRIKEGKRETEVGGEEEEEKRTKQEETRGRKKVL